MFNIDTFEEALHTLPIKYVPFITNNILQNV